MTSSVTAGTRDMPRNTMRFLNRVRGEVGGAAGTPRPFGMGSPAHTKHRATHRAPCQQQGTESHTGQGATQGATHRVPCQGAMPGCQ